MRILSTIVMRAAISFFLAFAGTNQGECRELERDIASPSEADLQYDFVMEKKAQEELFRKLLELKIGDSRTKIIEQLGQPTHDKVGRKKENNEFIIRSLYYDIRRWKNGIVNMLHDRSVVLDFDQADRLVAAYSNVEDREFRIDKSTADVGSPLKRYLPLRP